MTDDEQDVDAREAFALLGHEIRLDILLALLDDWVAVYTEPKSYAELMDAVGMADSGKFNYHLDQLRGVYVQQVDGGYVPTASATALYRAVLAHRPTEGIDFEAEPVDTVCPHCDTTAVLRYDRGFVSLDCSACEEWIGVTFPFPKHGVEERETAQLLDALDARVRRDLWLAHAGQCPSCAGTTTVDPRTGSVDGEHWVELSCETCSFVVGIDVLSIALSDDRVRAALREVGIDPEGYLWELPTGTVTQGSADSSLAVDVEAGSRPVTVVVDETLRVRSVEVHDTR